MIKRRTLGAMALSGLLALAPAAGAQEKISTTEAHLLSTFNSASAEDPYWVLTLQHFSTWRYGSNFFFLDVSDQPGLDGFFSNHPGLYVEYAPVVSLGALGVLEPGDGVLRDLGVTAQLNAGWGALPEGGFPIERVYLGGVEAAWSVPGFAVFNTQLMGRWEQGYDPGWQATWVYTLPFSVGGAGGVVTGFLDVWQRDRDDDAHLVVLAQPQLLVTLGSPGAGESRLQLGVELEPSYNFPTRGASDGWNLAISPMLRWVF